MAEDIRNSDQKITEGFDANTKIQPRGSSSGGLGCVGAAIKIFLFFLGYAILTGNFNGFYAFCRHALTFLIKKCFLSLLLLILTIGLLVLLSTAEEFLKKKKGFLYSLFNIIEEVPVLKDVLKIAPVIVEPTKLYKKALRKNTLFFGPLVFAIIAINAETPILSLFKLPPAKNTAAYIVYKISLDETVKNDSSKDGKEHETLLNFILNKYKIHSDPWCVSSGLLNPTIAVFESRMREKPELEIYSEFCSNGMSTLELIFEAKLHVRNADQIRKLIIDAPKEIRLDYEEEIAKDKDKTEFEILKENVIYIPYIFVNALFFFLLMPSKKRSFGKALTVSAYLIAALELVNVLAFSVLALTNYLLIASIFLLIISFLYLQVWLLIFVPYLLKISVAKTWFLGNIAAIFFQVVGLIFVNNYFHLNLF